MTPAADMEKWNNISVPVTHSAELQNLEKHAEYAIQVAANTSTVSIYSKSYAFHSREI